jgi:hypothetical protein
VRSRAQTRGSRSRWSRRSASISTDTGTTNGSGGRRGAAPAIFAAAALASAAAAVVFTWQRLFVGIDLRDESFSIVVPWRWALGDMPFVNEQNLAQVSSLLDYPFVKLFGIIRDYDVTGFVLYTRHLYLLLMLGVAAAVFLIGRRLMRWELALPLASVYVSFIFLQAPQLSYNTMGAAFLTLGAALGLWVVLEGRGRVWALASGAAFGLAAVAYPTLLFIVPFYAVFFAFALGRRAVGMVAELAFSQPPDPEGPPTGLAAWRALSVWVLGGAGVLLPIGGVILSFGLRNLERCWTFTMEVARSKDQLGGATKAYEVALGFWRFYWSRPYLIVAALVIFIVFKRWPMAGRILLAALPLALWLAGHSMFDATGFVLVYAVLAPYLFLFVPRSKREAGAKLLLWVWAPAMIAGAMTAFTSAAGYLSAPVGFTPALLASGVFLAWSLEAVTASETAARRPSGAPLPWLALAVLVAVVGVTVGFQLQQRDVPYGDLTSRFDSGPWWGIKVSPERRRLLDGFASDLRAQSRPDDVLLVFSQACGYYLFWNGRIAANSYGLSNADVTAPLPQSTISYYRRHRIAPTLVVHLLPTAGMTGAELQAACGGLDYPPALVRPTYALQRKPADESTAEVLAKLPRE